MRKFIFGFLIFLFFSTPAFADCNDCGTLRYVSVQLKNGKNFIGYVNLYIGVQLGNDSKQSDLNYFLEYYKSQNLKISLYKKIEFHDLFSQMKYDNSLPLSKTIIYVIKSDLTEIPATKISSIKSVKNGKYENLYTTSVQVISKKESNLLDITPLAQYCFNDDSECLISYNNSIKKQQLKRISKEIHHASGSDVVSEIDENLLRKYESDNIFYFNLYYD